MTDSTQEIQQTAQTEAFDENQFAMFIHLASLAGFFIPFGNVIGPLILWQMKRKDSEFVDFHGKEAVNFQITVLIALAISIFAIILVIGFLLIPAVAVVGVIIPIIAGVNANKGQKYRYPMSLRFIK